MINAFNDMLTMNSDKEFFIEEGFNASVAESLHFCLKDKKLTGKSQTKEKPWFDP